MKQIPGFFTVRTLLRGLLVMMLVVASAHAAAPRIFAITDVRIVTAPGQVIDGGTVVLRDGLIESVGAGVEAPPDATIIVGQDGWTLYPAFIDAASTVGLDSEPANGPPGRPGGGGDKKRPGSPHELEAVHPETAVVDQLDVSHSSVERHRELGFAVAHVLPAKGVFRGESAAILLRDAPARELILVDRLSQVIALETSSFMARQYPSSSIGAVATVRQTLLDAQQQLIWNERYAADPVGMRHPGYRASDAPLFAVLRREQPVVFVSGAGLDPGRFNAFATTFGLRAMTVAEGLAHRLDDLHAAGMPILLPLELPEKPELENADDERETGLRELQAIVRAPGLPAALSAVDIEFAFVTAGMKSPRDFPENLAAVVEAGLAPEQALAAVTTVPARLLGLERTLGTIEPGKLANLLIVEGELFTDKPTLRHMFVDGYHEEIEAKKPLAIRTPSKIHSVPGKSAPRSWAAARNQPGRLPAAKANTADSVKAAAPASASSRA